MTATSKRRGALILAGLVLAPLALAACSPDRSLNTGTPKGPDYCPCDIPPAPPADTQPNIL